MHNRRIISFLFLSCILMPNVLSDIFIPETGRVFDLQTDSMSLRSRILERRQGWQRNRLPRKEVCYDDVGCFIMPRKHSPLMKVPDSPEDVNTKFWLYRRENSSKQLIKYGDGSIRQSSFNALLPVKILIHGYKGSGDDPGALEGATAFLKQADVNMVIVDWERGAAGPSYPVAVANTELVGRQTALLLLDLIELGASPQQIHIVGFSLGAHVAACASYVLQRKNIILGRITGLDPASPIFKSQLLLQPNRKLDSSDAIYVDVIHTDGSGLFADGFGLLQSLGHADFFPNGGRTQPGCKEGRGAVVVSHFEGTLNTSTVCSHIRAWQLFLESLKQENGDCQFVAYSCPRGPPCFPPLQACGLPNSCAVMGLHSENSQARGPLYLVTRESSPFCGQQLRASVNIIDSALWARGGLNLTLHHNHTSTYFELSSGFLNMGEDGRTIWGLAAALHGSVSPSKTPQLTATLSLLSSNRNIDSLAISNIESVTIADLYGNSWSYCNMYELSMDDENGMTEINILLKQQEC